MLTHVYSEDAFLCWRPARLLCASASDAVSWQVSSWVLADRLGLHRQLRLVLLVVLVLSCSQPFVRQALASRSFHEAIKARESVVLHIALIEPEGELINVAAKMLGARMMVDADQPALENGKDALNAVRRNIISNELASTVVHRFMSEGLSDHAIISARLIRIEHRLRLNVSNDGA